MKYELLYIIPSRYTDTEVADIQKKVNGLLTQFGGSITKETNLGKIRLAYPIKQARHGTYILAYFDAETSGIQEFEKQLRLTDEVLRHMLVQPQAGAEAHAWELQSYVAPLSEEEGEAKSMVRMRTPLPAAPIRVTAAPPMKQEKAMSIEELDKKLDEILEEDLSKKA